MREYCVYCGRKIEKISNEHVIRNALGGLYESTEICCGACNNFISKNIDVPFTSTFNGIISKIPDMVKTNNKKSKPSYAGKALYKGKVYDVRIKGASCIIQISGIPRKKVEKKIPQCKIRLLTLDG